MTPKKILVIGAGPAGATIARTFAEKDFFVELIEARHHVAGNCYDKVNQYGHLLHNYGPHYFRTNSDDLLKWLSQFTEWIPGNYFVNAWVDQKEIPLPISLATMEALKGKKFDVATFEAYLKEQRVSFPQINNAEEQCLTLVGKELYEKVFKNYTIKQWGHHPRDLEPSLTARIPLRFDHDKRYPSEKHQCLPKDGYTKLFERILNHPNIHLALNHKMTPQQILKNRHQYAAIFYTGPIDLFFSYCFGPLEYRSLRFEFETRLDRNFHLQTVQLNFPNDHEFTRVVETKHITQQTVAGTTLCYEYPSAEGEPFYPMPKPSQQLRYSSYKHLTVAEENHTNPIYFVGRLAEYRYYNMDHIFLRAQAVAQDALKKF